MGRDPPGAYFYFSVVKKNWKKVLKKTIYNVVITIWKILYKDEWENLWKYLNGIVDALHDAKLSLFSSEHLF